MKAVKRLWTAALIGGLGIGGGATLHAQEFGADSRYYEDDALLDVTEWFDGNDYNPTDEAWWRWDDETYQARKDVSGDQDSDGTFGYTARDDNDWFYDYYDPYTYRYNDVDADGVYDYGSRYYDYDNDGIYDAFVSYSDWDDDGLYEDYNYYSFADTSNPQQRQQAKSQAARESRDQRVTGEIQRTKSVQVRGGTQHLVASIQPQQQSQQQQQQQGQGQMLIIDLGRMQDLKNINPKVGDTITVTGPPAQVGKQSVVLAKSVEMNGQTTQINRSPRQFNGKVLKTHIKRRSAVGSTRWPSFRRSSRASTAKCGRSLLTSGPPTG